MSIGPGFLVMVVMTGARHKGFEFEVSLRSQVGGGFGSRKGMRVWREL